MKKINQFNIYVNDQPGILTELSKKLSQNAVNILGISVDRALDRRTIIKLVTSDENTTRNLLSRNKYYFDENQILSIITPNRPGELAKISEMLSDNALNIKSVYILGQNDASSTNTEFILEVEDLEKSEKLLSTKY